MKQLKVAAALAGTLAVAAAAAPAATAADLVPGLDQLTSLTNGVANLTAVPGGLTQSGIGTGTLPDLGSVANPGNLPSTGTVTNMLPMK
jgi:hypothetical protein